MGYAAEHKSEMKAARKARKAANRRAEQARRKEARVGSTVLFRGPVILSRSLADKLAIGRQVRSSMSPSRWLTRETLQGRIFGPVTTRQANIVLLVDFARADVDEPVIAEIIDTGSDIRVHLFRCREVRGGVIVPELTICTRESTGPIIPPLMAATLPVWRDDPRPGGKTPASQVIAERAKVEIHAATPL